MTTDELSRPFLCYNVEMDSDFNIINQYLPTYKENFKGDRRWITKETDHMNE